MRIFGRKIPQISFRGVKTRTVSSYRRSVTFVDKWPLASFFILLASLLGLIAASHYLNRPKVETVTATPVVKEVAVYRIGTAPRITVTAQTQKSGVIQIVALTNGVIDRLYHKEGDGVRKGDLLVGMSTNYQGGNVLSLQRALAQKQYEGVAKTYPLQKELIEKQRDQAEETDENSDRLREITAQSISETQDLITLNEDILRILDENIKTLQQNSAANAALILAAKQQKSQFLAATNQSRQALRNAQYESNPDNPPAQLSNITKEIALKQLDIQQKQLEVNKDVSHLQLQIAQVNEGLMFPVAPFSGIVERVFVKEKEVVTPGTPLMVFSQTKEEDPISAVAFVPREIAQKVSRLEPSTLHIGDNFSFQTNPSFISTEAVEGTLYAIYFPIPDEYNAAVVNKGLITVDIPIGYPDALVSVPYVPLDAVYQTREKAYIFIDKNGFAASREISLGEVFGQFVEVTGGINRGDAIIVDRNVIEGDIVKAK